MPDTGGLFPSLRLCNNRRGTVHKNTKGDTRGTKKLSQEMVFMIMALVTAFRARQQMDNQAVAEGKDTGMQRYRREVDRANRDKVLVRDGVCYAVLWAWEFAALAGVHLRHHAAENGEAILLRYGVAGQSP